MSSVPEAASAEVREAVEAAVDRALHNVNDMLEGFWKLPSGDRHEVQFSLVVKVLNSEQELVEMRSISPQQVDLPFAYWMWKDREFR